MLPVERLEPEKWKSALQAAATMLCFFAGILFSGNFHWGGSKPSVGIEVTLIPDIPRVAAVQPEPAPAPKAKTPPPKQKLAEIVRDKKKEEEEKRKREEEKKRKEEEEKRKREEEKKRKEEEEKRKREEEKKRREGEATAKRLANEAAIRNQALQRRANRLGSDYGARIRARIQSYLKTPESVPKDEEIVVEIYVRLHPDGFLRGRPEVIKSSGYDEYDESAYRAVLQAVPLPVPKEKFITGNSELLANFTELTLRITPQ